MRDPLVVTEHSPLSHKELFRDQRAGLRVVPSWVPDEEWPRLAAYIVRAAYLGNVARLALPADTPKDVRDGLREYGDAALLRDRVMAGVLGTDWAITVDGADADTRADGPDIPQMPETLPTVGDPAAQAIVDQLQTERLDRWRDDVREAAERWRAEVASQAAARSREAAVRDWADRSQLAARIHEAESKAVGLGDSVMVLWPRSGGWPTVGIYDPGFYFPEIDEYQDGGYPTTVHLAWEFEAPDGPGRVRRMLRRITFELTELQEIRAGVDDLGRPAWLDATGQPSLVPVSRPDERVDSGGIVHRRYPWDPDDLALERWSTRTCVLSDGTWDLTRTTVSGLADLSDAAATWRVLDDGSVAHRLDLGIDFLPVVHLPNTPTGEEHFGQSVIDLVAQVLDDMAVNDRAIVSASEYIGKPTIAMSGRALPSDGVMAPGQMFGLGEKGQMTTLDLSAGIGQLMTAGDRLQDRYWTNGRVPAEIVGRAESGDVAGVTLALRFAPFAQLVGVLRMARGPKYRLLFRFAQRMAQVQGALDPGVTPETRLRWGNFMPSDREATIKAVAEAVRAHVMSTQTAVTMLVAAGIPIDDARAEAAMIRSEDTASANAMADALAGAPGLVQLVADRLGVELPETDPVPPITLPGIDAA